MEQLLINLNNIHSNLTACNSKWHLSFDYEASAEQLRVVLHYKGRTKLYAKLPKNKQAQQQLNSHINNLVFNNLNSRQVNAESLEQFCDITGCKLELAA